MKFKTIFDLGTHLLACKFFGKRYPLAMAFELTHKCNLNCPHCYASEEIEELGQEEHFRILDEIHEAGCKIVSFTGGEPLLVPYLPALVVKAKKLGMWVQYTTNGLLLPQMEKELNAASADMIQVSLDGDLYAHEKARGEGSFSKIMKALDVVRKNNWRCLIVSVMNKYTTVESLTFTLSKALDTGAFVSFQPLCDLPELGPAQDQLKGLLDFLKEIRKTKNSREFIGVLQKFGTDFIFKDIFSGQRKFYNPMDQSMVMLNYLYKFPNFGDLPCTGGRIFGRIRPDGQLVPCYYAIDRENPVNVIKDGFEKAWRLLNLPECQNCWHHHRLELNLIYNFSLPTLVNVLYYHLNKKYYRRKEH